MTIRILLLLLAVTFFCACAGPTSPFGAIDSLLPDSRTEKEKNPIAKPLTTTEPSLIKVTEYPPQQEISFFPKRQNVHSATPWIIEIKGVTASEPSQHLSLFYNGVDVTQRFLKLAHVYRTQHSVKIYFDNLRLPSDRYNQIEVYYQESSQTPMYAKYHAASCSIYDQNPVAQTDPYQAPTEILKLIEVLAPRSHVNPSLLAGIVAQESGFDPNAVSWAKAIGLTQVTPIAEEEILDEFKHFPRYPDLNNFSYPRIKAMIISGKINAQKEWRLNPTYSIQGGLAYLRYVDSYWRQEQNAQILKVLPGDPYVVYSQVLLASYNSGSARVKYAITKHGKAWLLDKKLREGRKYVNRVFSYCYHFSKYNRNQQAALDDKEYFNLPLLINEEYKAKGGT